MPLEIAVFTPTSALTAIHAGAHRIELCANYDAGGVTPSLDTLEEVVEEVRSHNRRVSDPPGKNTIPLPHLELSTPQPNPISPIQINVMIRPRPRDFTYSIEEFEIMHQDIIRFQPYASGFVFGILTPDNTIDVARNRELVALASPLPCTFHRAIDSCPDWEDALESVVECGFSNVLTSGRGQTALEGVEKLGEVQRRFGEKISIIAGGGVRSGNVTDVVRGSGVEWVHSAAITGEGGREECDGKEVERLMQILKGLEGQVA
jgi:copper homeostasis protein